MPAALSRAVRSRTHRQRRAPGGRSEALSRLTRPVRHCGLLADETARITTPEGQWAPRDGRHAVPAPHHRRTTAAPPVRSTMTARGTRRREGGNGEAQREEGRYVPLSFATVACRHRA